MPQTILEKDLHYDKFDELMDRREQIVTLLTPCPVTLEEIAQRLGLTKQAILYHIKLLMEQGIVDEKAVGRTAIYGLTKSYRKNGQARQARQAVQKMNPHRRTKMVLAIVLIFIVALSAAITYSSYFSDSPSTWSCALGSPNCAGLDLSGRPIVAEMPLRTVESMKLHYLGNVTLDMRPFTSAGGTTTSSMSLLQSLFSVTRIEAHELNLDLTVTKQGDQNTTDIHFNFKGDVSIYWSQIPCNISHYNATQCENQRQQIKAGLGVSHLNDLELTLHFENTNVQALLTKAISQVSG